jgi:energy-coupling factor transport system permease protein
MNLSKKIITFEHPQMASDLNREETSSAIEHLDPRVKFISLTLLALQVFVFTSISSLIAVAVVLVVAVIAAQIPIVLLLRRLWSVSFFILLVVCINLFTTSGDVLFEFLGTYATREGLRQGIMLSAQLVLLLLAATVFVQTTPIPAMVDGIETTLRFARKRFGAIIQVLTIALNFVPMLIQSAQQIKRAQLSRGARTDGNFFRQLRFAFSATVPLFAMTLRSSEQLALAMESRCYDPQLERSQYGELAMTPRDWITLLLIGGQFLAFVTIAV